MQEQKAPTATQLRTLAAVSNAVIDSVKAAGPAGAPAGVVFAALSTQGCTKSQFDALMSALVATGWLRRHGDLYFAD